MKTLGRLVRRYVLAVVATLLGILLLNVAAVVAFAMYWDVNYGAVSNYGPVRIANMMAMEDGAVILDDAHTQEEWLRGYAWAMLLDEEGAVIWRYQLPPELDHTYSLREVVAFTRWYLGDYPTLTYLSDYGTLVLGYQPGALIRENFYIETDLFNGLVHLLGLILLADLLFILSICLWLAWGMHRGLRSVEQGLDLLAAGTPVEVPTQGPTAELAGKLNQTGAHLRRQNTLITRRDTARTNWIAGVSHDIRTPLALIMGYAEQLTADPALPPDSRRKAEAITEQSQKIKSLVSDLNLTSKLQYNAQPLRRAPTPAGPLLRRAVTDFCNSGLAERCTVDFVLEPQAEQAVLDADAALLARAFENILNNSARHNAEGCNIRIRALLAGKSLHLFFADDGVGYPPAVLAAMSAPEKNGAEESTRESTPHILGLHLVEQIIAAHDGKTIFAQNYPHGAKITMVLPVTVNRV